MPQVEAERALAEVPQRADPHQPGDGAGVPQDRHHHGDGQQGRPEQATAVGHRGGVRQQHQHGDEAEEGERPERPPGHTGQSGALRRHAGRAGRAEQRPRVHGLRGRGGDQQCEDDTGEQPEGVRVRAEVDAARILVRVVQQDHHQQRGEARDRGDQCRQAEGPVTGGDAAAEATGDPQQAEEDQRPEDVELLLDRQRPVVHEDLRSGIGEVTVRLRDLHPVVREEQGAEELWDQSDLHISAEEPGDGGGDDKDGDRRGDDAPGTPSPELLETDPAGRAEFADEQGGDEEAGEDEEDVHTEEAAGQGVAEEVVDDHGEYGDAAQSVESGDAADTARLQRLDRHRVLVGEGGLGLGGVLVLGWFGGFCGCGGCCSRGRRRRSGSRHRGGLLRGPHARRGVLDRWSRFLRCFLGRSLRGEVLCRLVVGVCGVRVRSVPGLVFGLLVGEHRGDRRPGDRSLRDREEDRRRVRGIRGVSIRCVCCVLSGLGVPGVLHHFLSGRLGCRGWRRHPRRQWCACRSCQHDGRGGGRLILRPGGRRRGPPGCRRCADLGGQDDDGRRFLGHLTSEDFRWVRGICGVTEVTNLVLSAPTLKRRSWPVPPPIPCQGTDAGGTAPSG